MHIVYLVSVWLHVICATIWVGGIAFVVLVVVPWLRAGGRSIAGTFLRETGERFRNVGWLCFGVLAVTGTFNLWARGVRWASFADPEWRSSPFGHAVIAKLTVFAAILGVSLVHDFVVGPQATRAILRDPQSSEAQRLRARASVLGRLNAVFALLIVGVAVVLVRGIPW